MLYINAHCFIKRHSEPYWGSPAQQLLPSVYSRSEKKQQQKKKTGGLPTNKIWLSRSQFSLKPPCRSVLMSEGSPEGGGANRPINAESGHTPAARCWDGWVLVVLTVVENIWRREKKKKRAQWDN